MTTHLKTAYINSTSENIESLISYFQDLGGKSLSIHCRRQNAFKTKWTNKDETLIYRCHIQNSAEYLESMKQHFSKEQIKTLIADVAKYVRFLDTNEDVSFILISTNTLPSAIHFDTAKRLFETHQIRDQHQNNYGIDLLTIYSLRLSLESRIRGLLGIDFATINDKPVGLNLLIKIAKNLKSISYSKLFSWTEIEWVNEWINHHMHRLIRPYPWVIHQAIESLKSFVNPKEPIIIRKSTRYSFYSATIVDDEVEFQNEIETTFKSQYPQIQIKWKDSREIMIK